MKLLDFGIAKSGAATEFHVTETGAVLGTPFYMSPEQAVGSPLDFRTDLWSLGVVAFEAMTGTRPFQGATVGALTIAICSETPPVPSRLNAKIPPMVDAWLAQACARDRENRFTSARAMSDAFLAAVRGSTWPEAAGLAFQATALSQSAPSDLPPLPRPPDVRLSGNGPVPPHVRGLATTSAPLVRSHEPSVSLKRRGAYLAITGTLVAFGALAGFVYARRPPESATPAAASAPTPPPTVSAAVAAPFPTASAAPPKETRAPETPDPAPSVSPVIPPMTPTIAAKAAQPRGQVPPPQAPPPQTTARASATPHCEPPYFFDAFNNKVFKQECL